MTGLRREVVLGTRRISLRINLVPEDDLIRTRRFTGVSSFRILYGIDIRENSSSLSTDWDVYASQGCK